MSFFAAN
jgi:hypothetical protein